jgi:phosphoglycolate phosphatase
MLAAMRAAVFDLDGTLVDSVDDIASALASALADDGLPGPALAQVRGWVGDGARALVARAVAGARADGGAAVDRVLVRFRAHYRAVPVRHSRVYDGVTAVLDRLAADGWRLGVLSNKPHDLTTLIVDRLLPGRFEAVAGHRPGVPLKPDPTAAHALGAELGVSPGGSAMIGDSAVDVATAHAAGMIAIAVTWGLRPRAELVAAAPHHLVDTPAQLLDVLGRLAS